MEEIKFASLSRNVLDDLASALVEKMRYCNPSVEYPSFKDVKMDDGVVAEWFYPMVNGSNGFSELSSILTYTQQESKFEEIGELMLGIAMTEMKHYARLNDLIRRLGGRVGKTYNSSDVKLGSDAKEALQIALKGEQEAIQFYTKIMQRLESLPESKTISIVKQLVNKIMADEYVHVSLLNERIAAYEES